MKSPSSSLLTQILSLPLSLGFAACVSAAEPATEQVLSSLMLDIDRAGESERLVAVGDRGHVVWSDDMGKVWQKSKTPSDILLTAVNFPSAKVGYAAGHDAMIFKTENGGQSWASIYEDKDAEIPLLDIFFTDDNNGYALGAYGYLIQTRDGGKTWDSRADSIDNEDEFHFNAMTQLKDGTLMIVGEAGTLYRSLNNGREWETLKSPYEGSFFGVEPLEQLNAAVAFGLRGNAFITTDSGANWKELDTGTDQTLFGAVVLTGNQPLLVGSSGTYALNDGDDSLVANQPDRAVLTSIIQTRDNAFVVTGDNGIRRVDPAIIGL